MKKFENSVKKRRSNNVIDDAVDSVVNSFLHEGIDFDPQNRTVAYNPSHEDYFDTSVENNPTADGEIVPCVQVWSVFKRKRGELREDGNPLIYALKSEGWTFRTEKDREAVERQFDLVASKFASMYKIGITVLIPSGNGLNKYIADIVLSKSKGGELIDGVICKLTTEEVNDIVLDFKSKFREHYKEGFNSAYYRLGKFLDQMDEERNGTFSRHLIKDSEMRDVLDFTLKASTDRYAEFANKINGQNILIIDDTISRGQSIKEAVNIIRESYAPQSITVLTLLSKVN